MKTVAIFFHKENQKAAAIATEVQQWLQLRNIHSTIDNVTAAEDTGIPNADYIVSLGGDGTTLRAARMASHYDIPILGVFIGKLGFIAESDPQTLFEALERIVENRYTIDTRSMLSLQVFEQGEKVAEANALNEVVVSSTRTRMLMLDMLVSGSYVTTYAADGLIISTPTGSTAYNLSAGGPILSPKLDATIITPICAHTLNLRSLVVPGDDEIVIKPADPDHFNAAFVSLDGQDDIQLTANSHLTVKKSQRVVKFIRFEQFCFFEALRSKLKWSGKSH